MTKQSSSKKRALPTLAIVALAVIALGVTYAIHVSRPWTRDGRLTAQVVRLAPRVTGTVSSVSIIDNQPVARGDVLFVIDPRPFELSLDTARIQLEQARQQVMGLEAAVAVAEAGITQAEAGIATARARVDSARASVAAARAGVDAAAAGRRSAAAAIDKTRSQLDEARRERDRAAVQAEDGAGSVASAEGKAARVESLRASMAAAEAGLESAEATAAQADASLAQARAGLVMAEAGFEEAEARLVSARAALDQARANLGERDDANLQVRAAQVNVARAELELSWTTIRAPNDGYITNLDVDEGDFCSAGTPLLAFVDASTFHVEGFFRETQLRYIEPGDRAVVTLMSHRGKPIEGEVESIGWAINPPNIATTEGTSGLVPQIQPSFDWIRLAQRVPVRVRIENVPEGIRLVSGTTASVAIKPGARRR